MTSGVFKFLPYPGSTFLGAESQRFLSLHILQRERRCSGDRHLTVVSNKALILIENPFLKISGKKMFDLNAERVPVE